MFTTYTKYIIHSNIYIISKTYIIHIMHIYIYYIYISNIIHIPMYCTHRIYILYIILYLYIFIYLHQGQPNQGPNYQKSALYFMASPKLTRHWKWHTWNKYSLVCMCVCACFRVRTSRGLASQEGKSIIIMSKAHNLHTFLSSQSHRNKQ